MKRKVVRTEHWMNAGWGKSRFTGGGRWLILECGHQLRRKLSQNIPATAFCEECEKLRTGNGRSTSFNLNSKIAEFETWDESTQMPLQHSRPMTEKEIKEWIHR